MPFIQLGRSLTIQILEGFNNETIHSWYRYRTGDIQRGVRVLKQFVNLLDGRAKEDDGRRRF